MCTSLNGHCFSLTGSGDAGILMLPVERPAWNLVRSSVPQAPVTQTGNLSTPCCSQTAQKPEDQSGVYLLTLTSRQRWAHNQHSTWPICHRKKNMESV